MSKAMIQAIKAHTDIRGEVGVKWCDDAEIHQLNHQFRGIDKPTNVLSFPNIDLSPEEGAEQQYLGDIAISLETIRREAAEQGKAMEEHLAHMLIHGVLHLLGHDHEKKSEANAMETLEINILASLGIDNPYE